jgi:hypothetical protein
MICCTEPGLTEALYILYIHIFNNMQNVNRYTDNRLITADRDSGKRQTRPLVRESAPHQQTGNVLTVTKVSS